MTAKIGNQPKHTSPGTVTAKDINDPRLTDHERARFVAWLVADAGNSDHKMARAERMIARALAEKRIG